MASPIFIAKSAISATYTTANKTLTVRVKGKIPGFWSNPSLKRDPTFVGGLKYIFAGFPLGLGIRPDQDVDIATNDIITLPQQHFDSFDLLVQTADGEQSIPINYDGVVPPKSDTADPPTSGTTPVSKDLPPTIKKFLPMGEILQITAAVPAGRRSGVVIRFNDQYLKLVDATASDGQIIWMLTWAKAPEDAGSQQQLVEVNTDQWNGQPPPTSQTTHTVQGYLVQFVLLK